MSPASSNVDLNLLRVLVAVLSARSVSGAARELHLSQPAVSHALARLRALLSDELLVRHGANMEPTALAAALEPRAREALADAQAIFRSLQPFDPARDPASFTLAMPEHAQFLIASGLTRRLAEAAPHVRVRLVPIPDDLSRALQSGECDLVLSVGLPPAESLMRQKLVEGRMVYAVRKRHPLLRGTLTRERIRAASHVLMAPGRKLGAVGEELAREVASSGKVALVTSSLLVALSVVESSDAIVQGPEHALLAAQAHFAFEMVSPPWALPRYAIYQHWHRARNDEPAHAWLRGVMSAATKLRTAHG